MGDYNLNGLNPREFEHLVQALALAVIAPGVMPFGDGPDGGREATFRGRMAYPSALPHSHRLRSVRLSAKPARGDLGLVISRETGQQSYRLVVLSGGSAALARSLSLADNP
jgi:hypothetical protein